MALGDERRASGAALEQQRRASGAAMEQQRRASGAANEASRRNASQLADDINRLVVPPSTPRRLRTIEPRGGVAAQRGTGSNAPTPVRATGGGIAGPLVETETPREYHPEVLVPTTDGLAWGRFPSVKKVFMADANAVEFSMEYRNDVPE